MNTLEGDFYFRGRLRCDDLDIPANSIGDNNFDAAQVLTAIKQQHQYRELFRQPKGTAATARRETVHIAYDLGTLIGVRIQVSAAAIGDSTVTVDVLKNNVSVLTTPKVIDNSLAVYTTDVAGIATASYTTDANFEINVTISAGTGTLPQGLAVELLFREGPGA